MTIFLILTVTSVLLVFIIIFSIRFAGNWIISFGIASVLSIAVGGIGFNLVKGRLPGGSGLQLYFLMAGVIAGSYGALWGQRNQVQKYKTAPFIIPLANGKKLIFRNPFDNFLVYGGAGSGKTVSCGKHLLENYIKNGWAGFVYDFKETDYSKTAFDLVKRHGYPHRVVHINFLNLSCSHRVNVLKPSVVKEPTFLAQLLGDIIAAYMADSEQNEWYLGALGLFRGVGLRLFYDFPDKCTLPHIVNLITQTDVQGLKRFLDGRPESRAAAAAYLQAEGSEKTQASIRNSVSNYLSTLALDKRVQYILSGDQFDLDLINPKEPKLLIVANSFKENDLLSPTISLMLSLALRSFTIENKIDFFALLDEATTFKVSGFERLLSVLREYRCSFTILTQSPSKLEKLYGKLDLRSIEANCGNKFFGRSLDLDGADSASKQFDRKKEKKITRTTGQSTNSSSSSKSVSEAKEQRYDPSFFMQLRPGEFVGRAQNSNVKEFHEVFKPYTPGLYEEIDILHPVLDSDIEENYLQILEDVKILASK